jgi:cytochrome c biogenesis protein CcmG, thiol:disulfide interchange protein DsbE
VSEPPGNGQLPAASARRGQWARIPRGRVRIALAVTAVALAIAAVVSLTGGSPRGGPHALAAANNFTLPGLGHPSQRVALAAYTGRPVIVNFFASWCVPCRQETPLLARFYRAEHGRVTILGVDTNDATAAALRFARASGVTYPVGFDPASATATAYGVIAIPQTFFLNARHQVVRRVFGAVTMKDLHAGTAALGP